MIDNYDSFTFNLVQALQAAGATVKVLRNDAIDRAGIEVLADDPTAELRGIVISPGPGDPDDAGAADGATEGDAAGEGVACVDGDALAAGAPVMGGPPPGRVMSTTPATTTSTAAAARAVAIRMKDLRGVNAEACEGMDATRSTSQSGAGSAARSCRTDRSSRSKRSSPLIAHLLVPRSQRVAQMTQRVVEA